MKTTAFAVLGMDRIRIKLGHRSGSWKAEIVPMRRKKIFKFVY
jgi:hypothetical protein